MAGSFRCVLRAWRNFDRPARRTPFWNLVVAGLLGLTISAAPASAAPGDEQKQAVLKLKTPDAAVRLFGASPPWLWLSALFAPSVETDKVVAVPVTNIATQNANVKLSARFIPTNGLAMAHTPSLALSLISGSPAKATNMLAESAVAIPIPHGDTKQLKLELGSTSLPAGLYTGQIQFVADPDGAPAEQITQITPVEVRIRHSALCALFVIVLGIGLGRLSQLVYAPQMLARLQLLDAVLELEAKLNGIADATRKAELQAKLVAFRAKLSDRNADPAKLQAELQALVDAITTANLPPTAAAVPTMLPEPTRKPPGRVKAWTTAGIGWIGALLRALAGVTPLPLQTVYNWLLPILVLITFVALTITFMVQQYGGTGTAETFGSGGIADYAGLFLAGVASEAIASGLRAVKK